MNAVDILNTIAVLLAAVAAVLAWAFVVIYRQDEWETYPAGRHLMRFTFGIGVILTWSLFTLALRGFFEDHPWVEPIIAAGRIGIFGYVAIMLYGRLRFLLESHRRAPTDGDLHPSDLSQKDR